MAGLSPDLGAYLSRLTRLAPDTVVRARDGEVWAAVPWGVLVVHPAPGLSGDVTVTAAAWLADGSRDPSGLPRADGRWRGALPPAVSIVVETVPAAVLRRLVDAAAATLRETATAGLGGRAVGSRAVRDALLDHVPIVASDDHGHEARVPQRLVQAVARMGLLGTDDEPVRILSAGLWIGLATSRGKAWWRPVSGLSLTPRRGSV